MVKHAVKKKIKAHKDTSSFTKVKLFFFRILAQRNKAGEFRFLWPFSFQETAINPAPNL